jgi:mannose-1-phosphate guanylyltransferase
MYCVIMAGGKGTRFWPRSRVALPKQLLDIAGEKTMIQQTVERVSPLFSKKNILVVTGNEHAAEVRHQLPDIPDKNILVEPKGRNTAPCISLAALWIQKENPDAVMTVVPADHFIGNHQVFCDCLVAAQEAALKTDSLITIGITPRHPETGYGYIQFSDEAGAYKEIKTYRVQKFHEKPSLEKAREFVNKGNFLWNSGMFVWKTKTILQEVKTFLPELYNCLLPLRQHIGTPKQEQAIKDAYNKIEAISIDYGVMEKSNRVLTLKGDFGWNDIGSWSAIYDITEKDAHGNALRGTIVTIDAEKNFVYSPKKLAAIVGLKDVIVVETDDALLVCSKDNAQDVKKVVDYLEQQGKKEYL